MLTQTHFSSSSHILLFSEELWACGGIGENRLMYRGRTLTPEEVSENSESNEGDKEGDNTNAPQKKAKESVKRETNNTKNQINKAIQPTPEQVAAENERRVQEYMELRRNKVLWRTSAISNVARLGVMASLCLPTPLISVTALGVRKAVGMIFPKTKPVMYSPETGIDFVSRGAAEISVAPSDLYAAATIKKKLPSQSKTPFGGVAEYVGQWIGDRWEWGKDTLKWTATTGVPEFAKRSWNVFEWIASRPASLVNSLVTGTFGTGKKAKIAANTMSTLTSAILLGAIGRAVAPGITSSVFGNLSLSAGTVSKTIVEFVSPIVEALRKGILGF